MLGTCWSLELLLCFWRALRPRRQYILCEAQQFFRMYLWRQYWYAKLRKKFLQLKLPAILLILSSHTSLSSRNGFSSSVFFKFELVWSFWFWLRPFLLSTSASSSSFWIWPFFPSLTVAVPELFETDFVTV